MIIKKLKKRRILFLGFFVLGLLLSFFSSNVYADIQDVVDTKEERNVVVYKGDLVSLKVYSLTRIAITTAGIVEIVNADVDELLLIGKRVGETPMYIWDELGKRNITVRVFEQDLDMIIERIEKLFKAAEIEGVSLTTNNLEGKIVVTGNVPKDKKDGFKDIMKEFTAVTIDFTNEEGELIQIDAQISELTTTLTKALGFDWNTGAEGLVFGYEEGLPSFDGSLADMFRIGDINRTTKILVTVNALIQEGKGRVLSKPTVIVTDGESSTFMVGGEIPIVTTTQSSGGTVTENISFKDYGVQITVTPKIEGEKITLNIGVSIRDIDSANAVGANVAFTTTSASTNISLDDGQTIVLAGLIKHNTSVTTKRVPVLSKIPLVGLLFRSKSTPLTDKEVVISLTPRILSKGEKGKEEAETEDDFLLTEEEDSLEEAMDEELEEEVEAEDDSLLTEGKPIEEEQRDSLEEQIDEILEEELPAIEEEEIEIEQPEAEEEPALEEELEEELRPTEIPEEIEELLSEEDVFDEDNMSDAITAYVQSIQRKISQAISFPHEAKEQGWVGAVKLSLLILSDGSLSEVNVRESSGHSVFDKDAMNTTRILAPFDPFPSDIGLEEIWVTIPIIYEQGTL